MNRYRVVFKVQADGPAENDPDIEKTVTAASTGEAIDLARDLVRAQDPALAAKLWFRSVEEVRG